MFTFSVLRMCAFSTSRSPVVVMLPAAGGWTELALEDWLLAGVNHAVVLETVALCEARVADVTLIRFLACNEHIQNTIHGSPKAGRSYKTA